MLAQGCPHCPSVAFTLLPIHIYLFIDFYEVSLPSNPYCSCCPDHPLAIQLSVQLSVCHKENKNNKQQDLRVVYGERWLGVQGAGAGAFQPSAGQREPGYTREHLQNSSLAFLNPPGPLFLPYSWWEERLWSASPSEISGILAGPLNPHHHPLTRLWWPPPRLTCSVITPWRMLGPRVDWPTPQS